MYLSVPKAAIRVLCMIIFAYFYQLKSSNRFWEKNKRKGLHFHFPVGILDGERKTYIESFMCMSSRDERDRHKWSMSIYEIVQICQKISRRTPKKCQFVRLMDMKNVQRFWHKRIASFYFFIKLSRSLLKFKFSARNKCINKINPGRPKKKKKPWTNLYKLQHVFQIKIGPLCTGFMNGLVRCISLIFLSGQIGPNKISHGLN